ncbi:MAG TPA: carboxylate-amine ligase, partial [Thermoanaerobaculia bacterium]|nr:carboxylate-amine ligase [Thermoanaerobaculia bacterium]
MRPRPPFASELTIERELAEFERLKAHMPEVWASISPDHPEPHTSVIVPSMTLDAAELTKLAGASFYEERLLFLLIRLRNPLARVVFVTSQPVHPLTLEYYFQLLVGVPASHARARLTLLSANDASPRSLTQKILERPRLLERIRAGIADRDRAYLTVFSSTPLERRLAVLLGIPLNGVDPELSHLGSKSGSRKVFRRAGVDLPYGHEDLSTQEDVVDALLDVKAARPAARRAVVKLNESFSGEGNAVFTFPETPARATVETALDDLAYTTASETRESYFAKFRQMGGIVEEFLDGDEKASPSAQLRSDPFGEVHAISTHDQVLGGESGQVFLGCLFPAADGYRREVQEAAHRVGAVLAAEG